MKEPFSSLAFKVSTDPFVGSLTYLRVYSGEIRSGANLFNPLKGKRERIHKILQMHAEKRIELERAFVGHIVAVTGLKVTTTGETLCSDHKPIVFDLMEFPEAVISVAIEPKTTVDEKKLMDVLVQLEKEDPSFSYRHNKETGQLLIEGMGELHLEIIVDRLKREFKVGVRVGQPQVSYRESILQTKQEENTFQKEYNGKLQFGHVRLQVEPYHDEDQQQGVFFESKLTSKQLPAKFLKAVEKSIKDTALGGALTGYSLINLKVTLLEAQYREEDAAEVAYIIAASQAFLQACRQAELELLEPIMSLEIVTPSDYTGDIISDINMKRGKVLNMGSRQNKEVVWAQAPLAELFGYSTSLRSKSQGRAHFTMSFKMYQGVPKEISKQILEKRGIFI